MYKTAMTTSIENHINNSIMVGNTIVRWGDCCCFDRNKLRRSISVQPNRLQFPDAAVDRPLDSKDDVLACNSSDDVSSHHNLNDGNTTATTTDPINTPQKNDFD